MGDLSQTGTSVYPNVTGTSPNFAPKIIKLGETVVGGMPLYLKTSDSSNLWYKAIASGTAEQAGANGLCIAATAGNTSQWILGLNPGDIHIGASGVVGVIYCVSAANAGGIAPYGDLASTNYVTQLGQVKATGILSFAPVVGAALA